MLQKNLAIVPNYLKEKEEAYKRMQAVSDKAWPEYAQMLAWLRDKSLTLEAIGGFVGVSRERMRQVCDQLFPDVRKRKVRRRCGERSREKSRVRREQKFRSRSAVFTLLAKHQEKAAFSLEVVWSESGPLSRVVRYNGKRHYVMRLCSAIPLSGTANYAHALSPTMEATAGCYGLLVILDIDDGFVKVSRLYRILISTFRKKKQSHVLIRLSPRSGEGRKVAIDWQKQLVSSLD